MMPTGWSRYLHNYLADVNPTLLATAWQTALDRKVVTVAVAAIDKTCCMIPDQWAGLASLVAKPVVEDELLVDALLSHSEVLRRELLSVGASRQNNNQLRERLRQAVATGFEIVPSPQTLFPRLWASVAGEIVATAFDGFAADRQNWRAYALLALGGYVHSLSSTNLPMAANAINKLAQRSVLGMRGAVTRLPHEVRRGKIVDTPAASTSGSWHQVPGHSRFLMEVDLAIGKVQSGRGFISGFLKPNAPVLAAHRSAAASLSPAAVAAIRRAVYLQYDSLVIGVLGYSGIEQLLRSRMQRLGLSHRAAGGRPHSVLNWLSKLALPSQLESMIREAYDPQQANTRNRVWHSSFLMIDQCRPEIVQAIQGGRAYHPGSNYPESMARQATRLLSQLAQLWSASDLDFSWTSSSPLTQETENALGYMKWELDGADVLVHQEQFRLYVDNVAPTLSSLFKRGVVSTLANPPIEQLATLVLVFEGLLRHTCELMNIATVDLAITPSRQSTNVKMLDHAGLLADQVVTTLLAPLPANSRHLARDLLNVVVDFRNLFAHGAIRAISVSQRELLGRAVVQLSYLCGSVGLRHMIEERAHHLHREDRQRDADSNWIAGEADVFAWLRARLDALNALQPLPAIRRTTVAGNM